jgi:nickel transport protein
MKKVVPIFLLITFSISIASAHGVAATAINAGAVAAVEMLYNTGEPMAYAEISVFSPSSPDKEVIAGFADRNGRYAFVPDEDGEWRVEAADGLGHKSIITVNHAIGADIAHEADEGSSPLYIRALLGISIILNIFAAYSFVMRRKNAHQ